jgi:MtfA peptidase
VFRFLQRWRRERILRRARLDEALWKETLQRSLFRRLNEDERQRLRRWVLLFLAEKGFYGAHDFPVSDRMRCIIAAEACLPILNLDLDAYAGFHAIIIYPDAFYTHHSFMDEDGVMHSRRQLQTGESWQRGPVLLAWPDVGPDHDDGVNLVIHEFAHKLDMQKGGEADGCPPLHRAMIAKDWRQAFTAAWDHFCDQVDRGIDTEIDPYAAEAPEEFFAVLSEYFFTRPKRLRRIYPKVYRQLCLYYRQQPAGLETPVDSEVAARLA